MSEVRGADRHGRHTEMYRGQEYTVHFTPRVKLEIVVSDSQADKAIGVISVAAQTGHDGAGTILISSLDDTIDIQNGKRGLSAK
jgi:nitrogen regulatory protein P-II 1